MKGRKDISATVRAALLPELAEKLQEVEAVLRRQVLFVEDASLPGRARGSANPGGIVRLSPEAVRNISVVGEEIMHLHRWTSGYPAIEPTQLAVIHDYAPALQQLSGHFDEHAFFPFLERVGLNPRGEIHPTMQPQLEALERLAPEQLNSTRSRVGLPVVYVQAALLAAQSPERDALLKKFNDPVLAEHREVGRAICAEIDAAQHENPAGVERRMQRCLENDLRLNAKGAVVKTLTYPMK